MSKQQTKSRTRLSTYCLVIFTVAVLVTYGYFYFTEIKPLEVELIELRVEEQRLTDAILDEREKQSMLLDEMIELMRSNQK